VPVAGAVAGLVFVLTQLTGSDVDENAGRTLYTAVALVVFSALGAVGIGLARLQPRYGMLGAASATLSLLAFGAITVLTWTIDGLGFGFGPGETAIQAAWITAMLAFTTAGACGLILMTGDPDEEDDVRFTRLAGLTALTLLVALGILSIVDSDIEIGSRVYAILATVYVIGAIVALILRLLPRRIS